MVPIPGPAGVGLAAAADGDGHPQCHAGQLQRWRHVPQRETQNRHLSGVADLGQGIWVRIGRLNKG